MTVTTPAKSMAATAPTKSGTHEVNAFSSAYQDEVNGFLLNLKALLAAMEVQKKSIASDLRSDEKVGEWSGKHVVAAGTSRSVRQEPHPRFGERSARVPRAVAVEICQLLVIYSSLFVNKQSTSSECESTHPSLPGDEDPSRSPSAVKEKSRFIQWICAKDR